MIGGLAAARIRRLSPLLRLLLLCALLFPHLPAAAAAATPVFRLNRSSVDVVAELGSSTALTLRVTNVSAEPRAARLVIGAADEGAATPPPPRGPQPLPLPRQAGKLAAELARGAPERSVEFIVYLAERPDLAQIPTGADWDQRGSAVYQLLSQTAARSQAVLQADLRARGVTFRELWVANALFVRGTAALAAEIARRADVALVTANRRVTLPPLLPSARAEYGCVPTTANVCWNIAAIGAERVWRELGVRGAGITVATIDSGANYLHPALNARYRGRQPDGSYQHDYAWFDPGGDSPVPVDTAGHGTHVMGTMVGSVAGRPAFGVAPAAQWIAARACVDICDEADLIAAAQWLLAPTKLDGSAARPDLRPHVINNSWGYDTGGERFYDGYIAAWRAAGIFSVFAAGNLSAMSYPDGNLAGCSTVASPGDAAMTTTVGALDSDGRLATFSRIGPSVDGVLKPDLAAPGDGVSSSVGSNSYLTYSGTSMAAPHVAAAVALLWSANPQLIGRLDRTYRLLTDSAEPVTADARYAGPNHADCPITIHPNNLYGYGRLDAFRAVVRARPRQNWLSVAPWLGSVAPGASATVSLTLNAAAVPAAGVYEATLLVLPAGLDGAAAELPIRLTVPSRADHISLSGMLRDAQSGDPLRGVVQTSGGARVLTDAAGNYALQLQSALTHQITATALGYAAATVDFSAVAGAEATRDITLQQLRADLLNTPQALTMTATLTETASAALVLSATGTAPVAYRLSLEHEPYGVWRSDEVTLAQTGWITPPEGRQLLTLGDDDVSAGITLPFPVTIGDERSSTLRVSANGVVSLGRMGHDYHQPGCLPLPETFAAAIAVLRTDLDPSRGGEISVGETAEGVLVSWLDVPLFTAEGEPERRISAQVLIQPGGTFVLNYADISALTELDDVTIGVQEVSRLAQRIVCNAEWPPVTSLPDGLRIELRRQPLPSAWLQLAPAEGLLVPQGSVTLTLRAPRLPAADGVRRARLLLRSDDVDQPYREVIVTVEQPQAPFTLLLNDVRR